MWALMPMLRIFESSSVAMTNPESGGWERVRGARAAGTARP
jgi:hypothetical protein